MCTARQFPSAREFSLFMREAFPSHAETFLVLPREGFRPAKNFLSVCKAFAAPQKFFLLPFAVFLRPYGFVQCVLSRRKGSLALPHKFLPTGNSCQFSCLKPKSRQRLSSLFFTAPIGLPSPNAARGDLPRGTLSFRLYFQTARAFALHVAALSNAFLYKLFRDLPARFFRLVRETFSLCDRPKQFGLSLSLLLYRKTLSFKSCRNRNFLSAHPLSPQVSLRDFLCHPSEIFLVSLLCLRPKKSSCASCSERDAPLKI